MYQNEDVLHDAMIFGSRPELQKALHKPGGQKSCPVLCQQEQKGLASNFSAVFKNHVVVGGLWFTSTEILLLRLMDLWAILLAEEFKHC